jgi:hypothetical protein
MLTDFAQLFTEKPSLIAISELILNTNWHFAALTNKAQGGMLNGHD